MDDIELEAIKKRLDQGLETIDPLSSIKQAIALYRGSQAPQQDQGSDAQYFSENIASPEIRKQLYPGMEQQPIQSEVDKIRSRFDLRPDQLAEIQGYLKSQDPYSAENMVNQIASEGLPATMGTIRKIPNSRNFLALVPQGKTESEISNNLVKEAERLGIPLNKEFYGFESQLAKEAVGSEGLNRIQKVEKFNKKLEEAKKPKSENEFVNHVYEKIDNLKERFGPDLDINPINEKPVRKVGKDLVIDTYGMGDIHNAPTTVGGNLKSTYEKKGEWNQPHPFPSNPEKIVDALKDHEGKIILGDKSDPFMWMDRKYGITKKLLSDVKDKELLIRTRSDLAAHSDYIPLLRQNKTTVQFVLPEYLNDEFSRLTEPGAPSIKRRLEAAKRLKESGINVELASYATPQKSLDKAFGNFDAKEMRMQDDPEYIKLIKEIKGLKAVKGKDYNQYLPKNLRDQGYVLEYQNIPINSSDPSVFQLNVLDKKGKVIGKSQFEQNKKAVESYYDGVPFEDTMNVPLEVDYEHRRKGIASAMYEAAEKITGKKMRNIRPKMRTEEGQAFWNNPNRKFGKDKKGK